MASGDYGKIEGIVTVNETPAARKLIAVSYEPQDTGELDESDDPIYLHKVVGAGVSGIDGTYTLQCPEFADEVIVIALDDYGDTWQPNHIYSVDDRIRPLPGNETGYVYVCTVGGVSVETEPAWWTSGSNSVGTATFQAVEAWWPVAHAPIKPMLVEGDGGGDETVYPVVLDPYFYKVVSLISAESATLSSADFDFFTPGWTAGGSASSEITGAHFGSRGLSLNGTTDYIVTDTRLFPTAKMAFTFEAWVRPSSFATPSTIISQYISGDYKRGHINISPGGLLSFWQGGVGAINATTVIAADVWTHIAVAYDGTTIRLFVGGSMDVAAVYAFTGFSNSRTYIGAQRSGVGDTFEEFFAGDIDDIRITHHACRYTESFTPPVEPFPTQKFADGYEPTIHDPYYDTVLSLLRLDGDDNSQVITDEIGIATWSTSGAAALETDAAAFGASSLRIDRSGTDDEGVYSDDMPPLGSGDFTIEMFYRVPGDSSGARYLFDGRPSGGANGRYLSVYALGSASGHSLRVFSNGAVIIPSTADMRGIANAWRHFALVRKKGVLSAYLDGASVGSTTDWTDYESGRFVLGAHSNGFEYALAGYIDEFRVSAYARYTAAFAVPAEAYPDSEYDPLENLNILKITTQPESSTVADTEVAEFTVTARSSETIAYQWYDASDDSELADGGAIAGAATATLEITATSGDDGNTYYCIVTDDDDTEQTDTVTLTVT